MVLKMMRIIKFRFPILVVLIASQHPASGLDAPYLIDAKPLSHSEVELLWRNNSLDAEGFIIQRKDPGETDFKRVDSVAAPVTRYLNGDRAPSTQYFYRILSAKGGEVSQPSNVDTAVTLAFQAVLQPAAVEVKTEWSRGRVTLTINDRSNSEIAYEISRSTDFGPFKPLYRREGPVDGDGFALIWADEDPVPNAWNVYSVSAIGAAESASTLDTVFYFDAIRPQSGAWKGIRLLEETGSFPLDYPVWAHLDGDSLYLQEKTAPEASMSILNVSDPVKPAFAGYREYGLSPPLDGTFYRGFSVQDELFFGLPSKFCAARMPAAVFEYECLNISHVIHFAYVAGPLDENRVLMRKGTGIQGGDYIPVLRNGLSMELQKPERILHVNKGMPGKYAAAELGIHEGKVYGALKEKSGLTVVDFLSAPGLALESNVARTEENAAMIDAFAVPVFINGLLAEDQRLLAAQMVFLDRDRGLAFVVNETMLTIYRFDTPDWTGTGVIRSARTRAGSGGRSKLVLDGGQVKVIGGVPGGAHELNGRVLKKKTGK